MYSLPSAYPFHARSSSPCSDSRSFDTTSSDYSLPGTVELLADPDSPDASESGTATCRSLLLPCLLTVAPRAQPGLGFEWTSSATSTESCQATVPELVLRRMQRASHHQMAHKLEAALVGYRYATSPERCGILSLAYSRLTILVAEIRSGDPAGLIDWLSHPGIEQYKSVFNMADRDTGRTPLGLAILSGLDEVVGLLLKRGAAPGLIDMHGTNAHDLAVRTGNGEAWKRIVQACPQYRTVESLAGSARLAARTGKASIIEQAFSMAREQNRAPYVGASQSGLQLPEPLRAMLQVEQALLVAARHGRRNVINVLLAQGADLRAQDNRGRDALAHAIRKGHVEAVRVLLAHGAKADRVYADGSSAIEMAEDHGQDAIAALLRASLFPVPARASAPSPNFGPASTW